MKNHRNAIEFEICYRLTNLRHWIAGCDFNSKFLREMKKDVEKLATAIDAEIQRKKHS